jgi:hypothetical protein
MFLKAEVTEEEKKIRQAEIMFPDIKFRNNSRFGQPSGVIDITWKLDDHHR